LESKSVRIYGIAYSMEEKSERAFIPAKYSRLARAAGWHAFESALWDSPSARMIFKIIIPAIPKGVKVC